MIQIHLKKNKEPLMPLCNFSCDTKLDAKLDEYDLTKFMNCHSVNLIIGQARFWKNKSIIFII